MGGEKMMENFEKYMGMLKFIIPAIVVIMVAIPMIKGIYKDKTYSVYVPGSKTFDLKEKKYHIIQESRSYRGGNDILVSLIDKSTGEEVELVPDDSKKIFLSTRGSDWYILYTYDNKKPGKYELVVKEAYEKVPKSSYVKLYEAK